MGTETKLNCYTENAASGTNRVPKLLKHSSESDSNNTCLNNEKYLATGIVTSLVNNINTSAQQSTSQKVIPAPVPLVPIQIDENAVIEGATEILKVIRPTWDIQFVQFKKFTDGITNKLVGCFYSPPSNDQITSITNVIHNTNINDSYLPDSEVHSQNLNSTIHEDSSKDDNNDSGNLSDADAETEADAMSTNTNMTTLSELPTKNVLLVRVYGNKTDLLIDRKAETRNIILLHSYGFAPTLYATFKNGLVYDFVPGVTLNPESVLRQEIWPLVAKRMGDMHRLVKPNWNNDSTSKPVPNLWKKTQSFFDLVPARFTDASKHKRLESTFLPITRMRQEFADLYKRLESLGSPLVFSHNDLLLGNVIYTESSQTVTFIDYEYADYNYQAFDIGNHFTEFAGVDTVDYSRYPSRDFQLVWLRVYLQTYLQRSQVTDAEVETLYVQVNQFALAAHLFWTIWCLIQAEHSTIDFDYVEYAFIRYNEYMAKKDKFLSLDANIPKCKI